MEEFRPFLADSSVQPVAPIVVNDRLEGAIGIVGPTGRITDEDYQRALVKTSQETIDAIMIKCRYGLDRPLGGSARLDGRRHPLTLRDVLNILCGLCVRETSYNMTCG